MKYKLSQLLSLLLALSLLLGAVGCKAGQKQIVDEQVNANQEEAAGVDPVDEAAPAEAEEEEAEEAEADEEEAAEAEAEAEEAEEAGEPKKAKEVP
ncbi:MAG: hypothetical protein Q4P08_06855, partial [Eubacteriales bacterium]|nr:hypothetical protein [Eubacteriales bacterium]